MIQVSLQFHSARCIGLQDTAECDQSPVIAAIDDIAAALQHRAPLVGGHGVESCDRSLAGVAYSARAATGTRSATAAAVVRSTSAAARAATAKPEANVQSDSASAAGIRTHIGVETAAAAERDVRIGVDAVAAADICADSAIEAAAAARTCIGIGVDAAAAADGCCGRVLTPRDPPTDASTSALTPLDPPSDAPTLALTPLDLRETPRRSGHHCLRRFVQSRGTGNKGQTRYETDRENEGFLPHVHFLLRRGCDCPIEETSQHANKFHELA